jgi:hypothetical protein
LAVPFTNTICFNFVNVGIAAVTLLIKSQGVGASHSCINVPPSSMLSLAAENVVGADSNTSMLDGRQL